MSHDMKVLMVSYKIPAVVEMTTDATKVVVADSAIENAVVLSSFNSLRRDGKDVHWIGTPSGVWGDQMTENEKRSIREDLLDANRMVPVFLGAEQARLHFSQFCKRFLWPMFHYYGNSTDFNFSEWDAFREVNDEFARVTIEEIARQRGIHYEDTLHERDRSKSPNLMPMSPVLSGIGSPRPRYSLNDGKFLSESTSYAQLPLDVSEFAFVVQDYHLMLVPYYLRKRAPSAKISFFLHIPWPSSEIYRSLPIRDQLLQGLLSADMLSFQSFTFARHFLSCCTRILGLKVSDKGVHMNDGRFVRIEVMPIGIDAQFWERKLSQPETKKRMDELVQSVQGKKVLVSRDRMDYVKGIPTKLKAFRTFLTMYPEYQGKVVLFQECMPNPDINVLNDRSYKELEESIGQLVGSINGQYGSIAYTPIVYINRSVPAEESAAMYAIADLGIILPLRDGMNLSAYEFIVCQAEKQSPLILSEFAGAAQCLSGAVLANPWNEKKIAKLIRKCLEMPQEEKLTRFTNNFNYVKSHTNLHWISNLVRETCTSLVMPVRSEDVPELSYGAAKKAYEKANKRLIFLDYDGTLTPIVKMPHLATPSSETLNLLSALAADPKNRVYVISGRDRKFLEEWLGTIPIGLSGEHGSFVRPYPKDPEGPLPPWQMTIKDLDLSWKDAVMSIFEDYTDRTPGSFIEVKEVNITWHYRNADPDFGDYQRNQLILYLQGFGVKLPVDVINGDKAVEVRPPGINKGAIIKRVIGEEEDWDYVLCMGDDTTDEDMFAELKKYEEEENKSIFSCMVKKKPTMATNYVENQRGVLDLLHTLLGNKTEKPKSGHERRMLRNL